MTTKSPYCAGCRGTIQSKHYLTCSLCSQEYDLECANVSETRFLSAFRGKSSVWKCPACLNKQPKSGNANTPVGAAHGPGVMRERVNLQQISPMSSGSETDNVAVLRGGGGPAAGQALDRSYLDDSCYLENIRSVIRDEFERVVVDRMSVLITKVVTEQVTLPIYNKIAELTDRVVTLESELKAFKSKQQDANQLSTRNLPVTQSVDAVGDVTFSCIEPSSAVAESLVNPAVIRPTVSPSVSVMPNSQWTEVTQRRPRSTPAGVTRGAAAPGATKLEAAERRRQLHLYYVKVGTTAEEVREHLNSIRENNTYIVESLKARGSYASFKLDVPSSLAEVIMLPENWTEDICIKPWRQSFRAKSKEGQKSQPL